MKKIFVDRIEGIGMKRVNDDKINERSKQPKSKDANPLEAAVPVNDTN